MVLTKTPHLTPLPPRDPATHRLWAEAAAARLTDPDAPPPAPLDGDPHEAADALTAALTARFQFLPWDLALRQQLAAALLHPRWEDQEAALRALLQPWLPRDQGELRVPCAQYSPDLQLRLLGLRASDLRAPILDLGCGHGAALVLALREQGWESYGLDTAAPDDPARGLWRASWFDLSLRPGAWGTLLAHQSFSLHLLYAHLHQREDLHRSTDKYLELLNSLQPGGRLVYAPGLPFLEAHLDPRRFRVQRRHLEAGASDDMPPALRRLFGPQGLYAARVERR